MRNKPPRTLREESAWHGKFTAQLDRIEQAKQYRQPKSKTPTPPTSLTEELAKLSRNAQAVFPDTNILAGDRHNGDEIFRTFYCMISELGTNGQRTLDFDVVNKMFGVMRFYYWLLAQPNVHITKGVKKEINLYIKRSVSRIEEKLKRGGLRDRLTDAFLDLRAVLEWNNHRLQTTGVEHSPAAKKVYGLIPRRLHGIYGTISQTDSMLIAIPFAHCLNYVQDAVVVSDDVHVQRGLEYLADNFHNLDFDDLGLVPQDFHLRLVRMEMHDGRVIPVRKATLHYAPQIRQTRVNAPLLQASC